ncbi:MAG: SDR family NAD(P)-dependent oxidoreductase [Phenylobacterium sp.]|uniref:SDR family NAD(P)-dependent oxidoreductase n=1 Tax=Phenylobacterium sp. TaxID=1871053 RepID=UPI00391BAE37
MAAFQDKAAIVTGGASGIGAATVRRLSAGGARVLICDLNAEAGAALAAETGASFRQVDVGDPTQIEAMVAGAEDAFGGLDILINNAGVGSFGETPDLAPETWRQVMAIDLDAVFHACRLAIPLMRRGGGGAIVNTASISGLFGDYGFAAYNAAKAGVINYTRTLAIDHAKDGVRVNALCPGLIDTPLTAGLKTIQGLEAHWTGLIPMGRPGLPDEMAAVICFLASDEASYMTGSIVVADGGVTAHTGQPQFTRMLG